MVDPAKQRNKPFNSKKRGGYNQNDGIAGVVYILGNKALQYNYRKIGCTRNSGKQRASDLNRDARTGTPAHFFCAFEQKTEDCGLAEKRVFQRLKDFRRGKKGQEYFELPYEDAKKAVIEECLKVDQEYAERQAPKQKTSVAQKKIWYKGYVWPL